MSDERPKGLVGIDGPDDRLLPVFVVPRSIDLDRLSQLIERAVPSAVATLHGYRTADAGGMEWPLLVASPGGMVEGTVLLVLDRDALLRLDAYHGVGEGLYRRAAAAVTIAGRASTDPAFVYLPTERTLRRLARR